MFPRKRTRKSYFYFRDILPNRSFDQCKFVLADYDDGQEGCNTHSYTYAFFRFLKKKIKNKIKLQYRMKITFNQVVLCPKHSSYFVWFRPYRVTNEVKHKNECKNICRVAHKLSLEIITIVKILLIALFLCIIFYFLVSLIWRIARKRI